MSKEQVIKDKLVLIAKNAITANIDRIDDWRNSTHQM